MVFHDHCHRDHPLVLVIDDDITTRILVRASLEQAGFEVEEAEDGEPGLSLFQKIHPDIVLLDVMMPEMDGFITCQKIRELPESEHIPIVMVTGLEDTESINRAYEVGATDFITKPLNYTILNHRIRYLLRASSEAKRRQKMEEHLYQSQKMEAIGRLAGGIAHDFNNILMVIMGCSDLLLAELEEKDPLRHKIEEIRFASQQAALLTEQLLAFGRKQILLPQTFDMRDLVHELNKIISRVIGEDISLNIHMDQHPCAVKADKSKMQQIIMNLVVNARQAMPQGGSLTIEVRNVDIAEHEDNSIKAGSYVLISVSDTGVGMDPSTLSRIFEPFFTTKERDKGTGLGLSVVDGIVKQSNGYIHVSSEVGHGSTFKIYLPRTTEAIKTQIRENQVKACVKGSETVLVVEDDDMVRRVVKKILQSYGYNVLEASNGRMALSICKEYSDNIDILFTDIIMPEMTGSDLAKIWLTYRQNTKILFTSGYADNAISYQPELKDRIYFIQKPYKPEALAIKLREVLRDN